MGRLIRVILFGLLGIGCLFGLFALVFNAGMGEIKNLEIGSVDFASAPDGLYEGHFARGRWEYEVIVEVSNGRIGDITVVNAKEDQAEFNSRAIGQVLDHQTLEIDVVSGATVNTKALLKAVENALTDSEL